MAVIMSQRNWVWNGFSCSFKNVKNQGGREGLHFFQRTFYIEKVQCSVQSFKDSTIVNYNSRVVPDLTIPNITTQEP